MNAPIRNYAPLILPDDTRQQLEQLLPQAHANAVMSWLMQLPCVDPLTLKRAKDYERLVAPTSSVRPEGGDSTADNQCECCKAASVLTGFSDGSCSSSSSNPWGCGHRFKSHFTLARPASSVRDIAETAGCQYQVVPGAESSENGLCLHSATDGQYCNRHAEVRRMYGLSTESLPAPADTEGGAR